MENQFRKFSWSEGLTSLSTSMVTNSPRSPKNEKLQAIFERQHAKYQLLIMENRVEQLKKAKKLAEKEIDEVKGKTKQARKQIEMKNKEVNDKLAFYQKQKEFEDSQRIRFNMERKQRRKNIQNFEHRILKRRQKMVKNKKDKSQEWEDFRFTQKFATLETKRKCREQISSSYVDNLRHRCFSQRSQREKLKDGYQASIEIERQIQSDALNRITELELEETELIQELSKTMEMRNCYIENLNKIKLSY